MTLRVVKNSLLIEEIIEDKKLPSGLIIPNAAPTERKGRVKAIGADVKEVQVDEIVLFGAYGASRELEFNKEKYLILQEDHVLAILPHE